MGGEIPSSNRANMIVIHICIYYLYGSETLINIMYLYLSVSAFFLRLIVSRLLHNHCFRTKRLMMDNDCSNGR